jgi:hypothetical protein
MAQMTVQTFRERLRQRPFKPISDFEIVELR